MIRHTEHTNLSAEYDVLDGEAQVGRAVLENGTIIVLSVQSGVDEDYRGQILNKLLTHICLDANKQNANLSIMVPEMKTQRLKRYLEQFRFKETNHLIYKRLAGASIPPSVIY